MPLFANPSNAAQPYLNQVPGTVSPYFNPYIQAGTEQLGNYQNQLGQLTNNPGGFVNQIGSGYQQSPGFQFALQQALRAAGNQQAAGGMSGTPAAQFQAEQVATGLANQDYYNWLQQALGAYGKGLEGEQGLVQGGQLAGSQLGGILGQNLGNQAAFGYAGKAQQNQLLGGLLGGIGNLIGKGIGSNNNQNAFSNAY